MATIPPSQEPAVTALNVKLNQLVETAKGSRVKGSADYFKTSGPTGTITTPISYQQSGTRWQNEYSFSASYAVNDFLIVSTDTDYVDEFGATYTAKKGAYICIQNVPHIYDIGTKSTIVSTAPADIQAQWLRANGIDYTPKSGSVFFSLLTQTKSGGTVPLSTPFHSATYDSNRDVVWAMSYGTLYELQVLNFTGSVITSSRPYSPDFGQGYISYNPADLLLFFGGGRESCDS